MSYACICTGYMPFTFARFFVFALFCVNMCVLCFFAMGGHLLWANASTGIVTVDVYYLRYVHGK